MIMEHPLRTRKPEFPEELELTGSDLTRVEKTKYLGINIDENLGWDEQLKRVRSKISTGLKNILPQSQLYCVYYGDVVWGSLNK